MSAINFNPNMATGILTSSLTIKQNKKLETIELNEKTMQAGSLHIGGNPVLSNASLTLLSGTSVPAGQPKEIQVYGGWLYEVFHLILFVECLFDAPILDFAELDDCVVIKDPINFADSTSGTINRNRLTIINGDVNLAGLKPEKLGFLASITIKGKISELERLYLSFRGAAREI